MIETPFTTSPDPLGLHMTATIRSALARIKMAVDYRQGLSVILGDVGLGKSTLVRYLYTHYSAQDDIVARMVPIPEWPSRYAMMKGVCQEFGRPEPRRSLSIQMSTFQEMVFEHYSSGRNVILFVDEAQTLTNQQLELVRMLLNFETGQHKVIQIVLAGQLELRDRLLQPKHKALYSRVFAPTLLSPLAPEEMRAMLETRCRLAEIPFPFSSAAVDAIYQDSMGVPRIALRVAQMAWLMARELGSSSIDVDLVQAIIQEGRIDGANTLSTATASS